MVIGVMGSRKPIMTQYKSYSRNPKDQKVGEFLPPTIYFQKIEITLLPFQAALSPKPPPIPSRLSRPNASPEEWMTMERPPTRSADFPITVTA
jgi:hypothetical protein